MKIRLWKKLFLLTLVLLFLLPGCGKKKEETVTVYCLKEIDYGTGKTVYSYDEMGNVLEYYYLNGRAVCTYDENSNPLQIAKYSSDTLTESTAYTYNENGKMLTKTVTDDYSTYEYTYTYNKEGSLIQSVRTDYYGITLTQRCIKTFDAKGNPLITEYFSEDDDMPFNRTKWIYNSEGQCLSESNYQNGELFQRKLYTYDSAGNLVEVRDDPQIASDFIYRTEYTYDKKGNKLSEKEYFSFKGNREKFNKHFTYSYDKKDNLLEEIQLSPEDGNVLTRTVWTYDQEGTIRSKTHKPSKNHTQISTYDAHGNLISYEWSHSNGSAKITYSYITFELPKHLAEKVQLQQDAVFKALEYSQIG